MRLPRNTSGTPARCSRSASSTYDGVISMIRRYRIEHRTIYRYSDEVSTSFGRGYLNRGSCPGSAACSTT